MISIKETKEIREKLNLTHVVIFGIDEMGRQHVSTHGETKAHAEDAAIFGNRLKETLNWPIETLNSKPLERKCENCSYFQFDITPNEIHGECTYKRKLVNRYGNDVACHNFEPNK